MRAQTETFIGVSACNLAAPLPEADVILFGAADATPYVARADKSRR
jgi:agmatinase